MFIQLLQIKKKSNLNTKYIKNFNILYTIQILNFIN